MGNLWKSVSEWGIDPGNSFRLNKRIRISNRIFLINIALLGLSVIANILSGPPMMNYVILAWLASISFCLVMNKYGYINSSRIIYMLLTYGAIFFMANMMGPGAREESYLFASLAASFLLFDFKEKGKIIFGIAVALLTYVTLRFTEPLSWLRLSLPGEYLSKLEISNFVFSLVLTAAYLVLIILESGFFQELLTSEKETNQSIINASNDSIWLLDENCRLVNFNQKARISFKGEYGIEIQPGMDIYNTLHHKGFIKDASQWESHFSRALDGENFREEMTFANSQRATVCEVTFSPVHVNSRINGVAVFVKNITERKEAERELLKYHTLINHSNDFIFIVNPEDGKILDANLTACEQLQYTKEELLQTNMADIKSIFKRDLSWAQYRQLIEERNSYLYEAEYCRKGGDLLPVEISARLIWYSEKPYLMVVAREISKRKEYEEAILGQQKYLNQIINSSPNLLWVKNKQGKYKLVNNSLARVYNTTPEDMLGKTDAEFGLQWEEVSFYHKVDQEVIETRRATSSFEEAYTDPNTGKTHWYHIIKSPIIDGDEIEVLGIAIDIGQRKQLEKEISELNSLQKAIIDGSDYSVISSNLNGIITSFNKFSEEMLGYSAEEVKGKCTVAEFILKEEIRERARELSKELEISLRPGIEALTIKAEMGLPERKEWTFIRKNGQHIIVSCTVRLMLDEEKNPIGYLFISNDITDKKKLEEQLQRVAEEEKRQAWINTGLTDLNEILRKHIKDSKKAYEKALAYIADYIKAQQGLLFTAQDWAGVQYLEMTASYASGDNQMVGMLQLGEGLIGQVAKDLKPRVLKDVPKDFIKISTGLGEAIPRNVTIVPLVFEEEAKGVIELAALESFSSQEIKYLEQAAKALAATIDLDLRKAKTEQLLVESQELNEKLKAQEEELRLSNEELLDKSSLLQASEEELREQQEELMEINKRIEEKASLLEKQNEEIRIKNEELENARLAIKLKAEELEISSRYKSEFLANMSHELRTPLNSILILSNLLLENKEKALSGKQLEFAEVIKKSGRDLLTLINDVLDLAKIESGKVELSPEDVKLQEISDDLHSLFDELAKEKGIAFNVSLDKKAPGIIHVDKMRLEQVLKNLLSNAFKFTSAKGKVELEVAMGTMNGSAGKMFFNVKDTGIGIPDEKRELIFEAFRQADGSTSRKFGGTGLGLSISKELAALMGGELQLESEPGKGSCFTLILPEKLLMKQGRNGSREISNDESILFEDKPAAQPRLSALPVKPAAIKAKGKILDEKEEEAIPAVLIIEDDRQFAGILGSLAKERGFTPVFAQDGTEGLNKALAMKPAAILLDINLPDMNGWELLRKLKGDSSSASIPVHAMSATDYSSESKTTEISGFTLKSGEIQAFAEVFDRLNKEFSWTSRKVLIIEDSEVQASAIRALLAERSLQSDIALNGNDGMEILMTNSYDLVILDLTLPDVSGLEMLQKLHAAKDNIKIIVYTGHSLTRAEEEEIMKYTDSIIQKSESSYERLLDEIMLFFHKLKRINGSNTDSLNDNLKGRKVLLVDDDMRNIFALSHVLQQHKINVLVANDGREAIQRLDENPDTELVLMDIMMPEMNGYEATSHIRGKDKYKQLPIIALTANAMKGDREKCLEAGASDYIAKPVDTGMLLSLMRVWLNK